MLVMLGMLVMLAMLGMLVMLAMLSMLIMLAMFGMLVNGRDHHRERGLFPWFDYIHGRHLLALHFVRKWWHRCSGIFLLLR